MSGHGQQVFSFNDKFAVTPTNQSAVPHSENDLYSQPEVARQFLRCWDLFYTGSSNVHGPSMLQPLTLPKSASRLPNLISEQLGHRPDASS
jgi:hypothetical protein